MRRLFDQSEYPLQKLDEQAKQGELRAAGSIAWLLRSPESWQWQPPPQAADSLSAHQYLLSLSGLSMSLPQYISAVDRKMNRPGETEPFLTEVRFQQNKSVDPYLDPNYARNRETLPVVASNVLKSVEQPDPLHMSLRSEHRYGTELSSVHLLLLPSEHSPESSEDLWEKFPQHTLVATSPPRFVAQNNRIHLYPIGERSNLRVYHFLNTITTKHATHLAYLAAEVTQRQRRMTRDRSSVRLRLR